MGIQLNFESSLSIPSVEFGYLYVLIVAASVYLKRLWNGVDS